MLPRKSRIRTAADFAAVIKAGRRAGTGRIVVHALVADLPVAARAGFVVSGKVGNSVVRHRVTRRLRPLVRAQLETLAPGTAIVVRALPTAALATSAELGADLRSGVAAAVRKASIRRADASRTSAPASPVPVVANAAVPTVASPGPIEPTRASQGGAT